MSFLKDIGKAVKKTTKTVTKVAGTAVKTGTKVATTAPKVVNALGKQSTYTSIGKGALSVTGKVAVAPLGFAKKGLKEIGIDGSFLKPWGTFLKFLPYIAVVVAVAWFIVEYRKGNNRIVVS